MQTENEFLRQYEANEFNRPNITIDNVIFTVQDNHLYVLLVKRAEHPFKDSWSLVGGYIDVEKDACLEAAATRKLIEKTGVKTPYLEQFATIGNPHRDPRGWSTTVVYLALVPPTRIATSDKKAVADLRWSKITGNSIEETLAFDHSEILIAGLTRLRNKVLYTSLPLNLMPDYFTLGELQKVYEIILAQSVDHKSFRRRILNASLIEATGEFRTDGKRPAQLYQLRKNQSTHFFIRSLESCAAID